MLSNKCKYKYEKYLSENVNESNLMSSKCIVGNKKPKFLRKELKLFLVLRVNIIELKL